MERNIWLVLALPPWIRHLGTRSITRRGCSRTISCASALLAKNGVYILENMDTRALADGATEFLLVLGALPVGAVQAVINLQFGSSTC